MSNPILDLMAGQMGRHAKAPDPMEMYLKQHPNYQQVMNLISQNGGTAKDAFFNICKQRGIDPNQIIQSMQNGKR